MIEMRDDTLVFSFPEVHADAVMIVEFQRTLRIPDDDRDYPLPPGLGTFPLRHVDDAAGRVPQSWLRRGGVMLPMYQSEAMWLNFRSPQGYPFALKVGTGKVNAVTGAQWADELKQRPQDYLSVPEQPWLDGYCVEKGLIRQFVAMPLGSGYSAEEQLTGKAEVGGVQLVAYPLKAEVYDREREQWGDESVRSVMMAEPAAEYSMGLAPGGRMKQEVYDDPQDFGDWDFEHRSRCFVHTVNSLTWRAFTEEDPPTTPPTSAEYERAGLPWFEYYGSDREALSGGEELGSLRSVAQMGEEMGEVPLPENESVHPKTIVRLRQGLTPNQVREGTF